MKTGVGYPAAVAAMLLSLWCLSLPAHHIGQPAAEPWRVLEGSVVEFVFANPHSSLRISVETEDGAAVVYDIDLGAAAKLVGLGIQRNTFAPGDQIAVNVWRRPDFYSPIYLGRGFRTANGTLLGDTYPIAP